jgi:hypothetical protein
MIEQLLGWIANIGFLLGAIWLTQKKIAGFYIQVIANGFYAYQSLIMHNYSLFWLSLILIFINIRGVIKWSK